MAINFTHIRSQLTEDARNATLAGVRTVLTEENTDILIERMVALIKPKLPVYLRWIPVGTVLDALLPGALLKVFEEVLGA